MSKTCPECGLKNNNSLSECIGCYTSLVDVQKKEKKIIYFTKIKDIPSRCPFCDAKMKPSNSTCPICFKDTFDNPVKNSSPRKDTKELKKAIRGISVIAIIFALGIYINSLDSNKEYKPVKDTTSRAERIEKQFSAWDGSHISLTRLIKDNLKDPDSYKHDKTIYFDKETFIVVKTTYRAKNSFGGYVIGTVSAKIDLDGNILEIISQE